MNVGFKDKDYVENIGHLSFIEDIYKGTRALKNKGSIYMQPFPLEDEDTFKERVNRSTFFNFFNKAVNNLSSILLRKDPKINYKVKDKKYIDNIDGTGTSLNMFIKEISKRSLLDGLTYIWVDSQKIESDLNLSEADSIKPYLKNVLRKDVINKTINNDSGESILEQVVIKQIISESVDEFETKDKEIFIVLRQNEGIIYKDNKNSYEEIDRWEHNLGYVPLIPVYSAKTGYLEADIPLLDIAYLNLSHYNFVSILQSMLRIAGVPVPVLYSGEQIFKPDVTKKKGITIGVNAALSFKDKSVEGFEWIEFQGTSLDQQRLNIKDLEESMEKLALSVISTKTFNTATEALISDSNNNLFLVELSYSLETAMNQALFMLSDYMGRDLGIEVGISHDLNAIGLDANTIDKFIQLKRDGMISLDTLWEELIKGEMLNIKDFDLEKQKISDEMSDLTIQE